MDPGTAILVGTAIATAAKAGGDYFSSRKQQRAAKQRAKETKRETLSGILNDAIQGSADLHGYGLARNLKNSKRKSNYMQDTSDLVRRAFEI